MDPFGMDDFVQPQIQESCRLALPEGLRDLMCDISREVLRAQPRNLLGFITNYLSALLVTRENLSAASRICDDICDNLCAAGLDDMLMRSGIDEEDIKTVKSLVEKYFKAMSLGKPVKEEQLMAKIVRKTSINEEQVLDVIEAVRKAFLQYQVAHTTVYEMTPDDSMDDITRAAHHTLSIYRKAEPSDDKYERAATRIQAAYRAYGIRRQKNIEASRVTEWSYAPEIIERVGLEGTNSVDKVASRDGLEGTNEMDEAAKLYGIGKQRRIQFDSENGELEPEIQQDDKQSEEEDNNSQRTKEIYIRCPRKQTTSSSISLAGSFIATPKLKPYCAHDGVSEDEDLNLTSNVVQEERDETTIEKQQKGHIYIDYTKEHSKEIEPGEFTENNHISRQKVFEVAESKFEPTTLENADKIEEHINLKTHPTPEESECEEYIEENIEGLDDDDQHETEWNDIEEEFEFAAR